MDQAVEFVEKVNVKCLTGSQLREICVIFRLNIPTDPTVEQLRGLIVTLKRALKNKPECVLVEEFQRVRNELLLSGKLEEKLQKTYPHLSDLENILNKKQFVALPQTPDKTGGNTDNLKRWYDFPHIEKGNSEDSDIDDRENREFSGTEKENIYEPIVVSTMAEKLPTIHPITFSGLEVEDVAYFFEKFDLAAKANNWSQVTKKNVLPNYLTGAAYKFYKVQIKDEDREYNQLKGLFIRAFTRAGEKKMWETQLERTTQENGQQLVSYVAEVRDLCNKVDDKMSQEKIMDYIIGGLLPEIYDFIAKENPRTLAELDESIRRYEIWMAGRNRNKQRFSKDCEEKSKEVETLRTKVQELEAQLAKIDVQEITANRPFYNKLEQKRDGFKLNSEKYEKQTVGNRMFAQKYDGNQRVTGSRRNGVGSTNTNIKYNKASVRERRYFRPQETRNCYYCGKQGHLKGDCFKWLALKRQEQSKNL